jgi:ABC-type multidrug transport system fused ATPase/permease subunit
MLIMGLLDPDRGTIKIGGADLKQTPRKLLPELMGIVSADFPLLRGSIRKNVFYRRNKASEEEFTCASQMSGLDQVLAKYPEGLETRLSTGGSNLSVSERQCIALARALMGLPPLLLIDETGLAADLETKRKIRSLMAEYPGTILLITYDDELKETATKLWEVGLTMPSAERTPASIHA